MAQARSREYLRRTALLDVLRRRAEVRLTLIEGGPGFGKSVLVDQFVADPMPGVRDLVVTCGASHRHLSRLTEDLRSVLGVSGPASADPRAEALVLADAIALAVPTQVVVVIDDAQVVEGTASDELIRQLLGALPANGHLVVSTHARSGLPIASLVSKGKGIVILEDDLAFSDDEWAAFARERGVDPTADIRWPALAELTAATGESALVRSYLLEEVVQRLDAEQRWLLGAVVAVGGADDALASLLVERPVSVDAELRAVSLVRIDRAGWARPHQLWREAIPDLVTARQRNDAILTAAAYHRDRHRDAEAGRLLVAAGLWTDAGDTVLAALSAQPPAIPMDELSSWIDMLPTSARGHAGWRLANALRIYEQSLPRAKAELEELVDDLDVVTHGAAVVTALFQLGTIGRRTGDTALLDSIDDRLEALAAEGHARAAAVRATVGSFRCQVVGRIADGLRCFEGVPMEKLLPEQQAHVLMMEGNLHLLDGDAGRARSCYERAAARGSAPVRLLARELAASARFVAGDVEAALDEERACVADAERFGLTSRAAQFRAMLAAMAALTGRVEEAAVLLSRLDGDVGRSSADVETRALTLLASALVADARGDTAASRALLAGIPDPRGNLQRAMALPAAAVMLGVPEMAGAWRSLSAGLVTRLAQAIDDAGSGDDLGHLIPAGLRRAGPSGGDPRAGAGGRARLELVGALQLSPADLQQHQAWRRGRVRELLCALVLRGPIRRDALAELLWPQQDPTASLRNLRVHLAHLADVFEPERAKGSRRSWLDDAGGMLSVDTQVVATDLDDLARALARSADAEARGDAGGALGELHAAVALWRGELAADVDAPWLDPHRHELSSRVLVAALRAAELGVVLGRASEAAACASTAVRIDPFDERGRRALAEARAAGGDRLGALRAIDDAVDAAAELGTDLDPATIRLAARLGHPSARRPQRRPG